MKVRALINATITSSAMPQMNNVDSLSTRISDESLASLVSSPQSTEGIENWTRTHRLIRVKKRSVDLTNFSLHRLIVSVCAHGIQRLLDVVKKFDDYGYPLFVSTIPFDSTTSTLRLLISLL